MRLYKAVAEGKLEVHDAYLRQVKDITKYNTPYWFVRSASIHKDQLMAFCENEYIPVTKGPQFAKRQNVNEPPPGKMPKVAIRKLTIEAAWGIEVETGRTATASAVIERLHKWVDDRKEGCLISKTKHGVTWMTTKCVDKPYDLEACRKTLKDWHKTRK
jgi:hypothetical protein